MTQILICNITHIINSWIFSYHIDKNEHMYYTQCIEHVFERRGVVMNSLDDLEKILSKLDERDECIIKQLIAILFRYLEKRGRI